MRTLRLRLTLLYAGVLAACDGRPARAELVGAAAPPRPHAARRLRRRGRDRASGHRGSTLARLTARGVAACIARRAADWLVRRGRTCCELASRRMPTRRAAPAALRRQRQPRAAHAADVIRTEAEVTLDRSRRERRGPARDGRAWSSRRPTAPRSCSTGCSCSPPTRDGPRARRAGRPRRADAPRARALQRRGRRGARALRRRGRAGVGARRRGAARAAGRATCSRTRSATAPGGRATRERARRRRRRRRRCEVANGGARDRAARSWRGSAEPFQRLDRAPRAAAPASASRSCAPSPRRTAAGWRSMPRPSGGLRAPVSRSRRGGYGRVTGAVRSLPDAPLPATPRSRSPCPSPAPTRPRRSPTRPAAACRPRCMRPSASIVGQDAMLERVLVALLAGGHVLLEGVPGLAKTLTVRTLAQVLGGSFSRVQFTPDLVPADLVGTRIWHPDRGDFRTELGPVFANLLLADEINRAPAKVQSALLEVMQEQQVTIGGDGLRGAARRSSCSRRRTRSSPRAPTRCPRRRSTASCSSSSSTTRRSRTRSACSTCSTASRSRRARCCSVDEPARAPRARRARCTSTAR